MSVGGGRGPGHHLEMSVGGGVVAGPPLRDGVGLYEGPLESLGSIRVVYGEGGACEPSCRWSLPSDLRFGAGRSGMLRRHVFLRRFSDVARRWDETSTGQPVAARDQPLHEGEVPLAEPSQRREC